MPRGIDSVGCIVLLSSIPVYILARDLILVMLVLVMGGMTVTNGVLLLVVVSLLRD